MAQAMTTTIGTLPVHDFDGALIRAYSRRLATVVSISGAVTVANASRVLDRVRRHVLDDSVVLDLGGLDVAEPGCGSLIDEVYAACRAAGVEFALVAADDVVDALGVDENACPVAGSVPEALRYFADVSCSRQRVLLPLLGRIA